MPADRIAKGLRGSRTGEVRRAGKKKELTAASNTEWPAWRGPNRDGIAAWLPDWFADSPKILWRKRLTARGLAGVSATRKHVIVVDRDITDSLDVFRCLDSQSGEACWTFRSPATGDLDYGNSPRATPLFHGDVVFLLGAFGHLHCVDLVTGKLRWQKDLRQEFGAIDKLVWGACSSPLVVDGKLIVNPGGPQAALVALDPAVGSVIWKCPGLPAAYGSFLAGEFGGRKQLVGYDQTSLGGWDVATGKRLWTLQPPRPKDFNVPTPIRAGETLIVSTENNGTRQYGFRDDGTPDPLPLAVNLDLAPDTHTPVLSGSRLFGVWNELYCLDVSQGMKTLWTCNDSAFAGYTSLIASGNRLLAATAQGEILLIDAAADSPEIVSRFQVFPDDDGVLSHPAIVDRRLFLRGSAAVCCIELV